MREGGVSERGGVYVREGEGEGVCVCVPCPKVVCVCIIVRLAPGAANYTAERRFKVSPAAEPLFPFFPRRIEESPLKKIIMSIAAYP